MTTGVIHLDGQPPIERTGLALPFSLEIDRQHVVQAHQFGELVGRDVIRVGIDEIEFDLAAFELLLGLVLVDRLERRVVRDGAAAEGEPPGMRDALA